MNVAIARFVSQSRPLAERLAGWLLLLAILGMATAPVWVQTLESPPLEYPSQLKVLNAPVVRGHVVQVQGTRCNNSGTTLNYTFNRRFERVDPGARETITLAPASATASVLGCETLTNLTTNVFPESGACGRWIYAGAGQVQGKSGRTHSVAFASEPFLVEGCEP